jgi:hypothetical protein
MISIILIILGIIYLAINLITFGMALCFMSTEKSLWYLFFGTLILLSEFILEQWEK